MAHSGTSPYTSVTRTCAQDGWTIFVTRHDDNHILCTPWRVNGQSQISLGRMARFASVNSWHECQARACGNYFSSIPIAAIYASTLARAHATAKAILDAQPDPRPALIVSPDLREQHFGAAEGEPKTRLSSSGVDVERKIFPILHGRDAKFPDGESLNDVALRAARVIDTILMPWVSKSWGKGEGDIHLVVVSHGICISEIIQGLVRRDETRAGEVADYLGLLNTAWTSVTVGVKDEGTEAGHGHTVDKSTPLVVRVTNINQRQHLFTDKDGIGSAEYDPTQRSIREFFGGGTDTPQ